MVIGIDDSPISSAHSARGIGTYTSNLIRELEKQKGLELLKFSKKPLPKSAQIIHYPYFDLFFHTLPVKKTVPRIVTIHDVIPLVFPEKFPAGIRGKINLKLQKIALRNTDAVICDSNTSKADVIKNLGFPESKIFVVYLAPSTEFKIIDKQNALKNVHTKYKLPKEFILYVGDVNWNKNIPNLLKAISIAKIPLVIVGKAWLNTQLTEVVEIEKIIDDLKIKDKILKLGFVNNNDLASIYNLAESTVLPSYYEGFGLPVLESMACGTPVVCSDNSSLSEIGGSFTLFCNPDDPADIANKIEQTLSGKLKEKNAENFALHASKYSWKKTARETYLIYKSLNNNINPKI